MKIFSSARRRHRFGAQVGQHILLLCGLGIGLVTIPQTARAADAAPAPAGAPQPPGKPEPPPAVPDPVIAPAVVPLSVTLSSPTGGASIALGGSFSLVASTSGSYSIVKVDFYSNGVFLGQDASAPYTKTYTPVAAGSYSLTAIATDTVDASAQSAPVSVTVTANVLPTVSLTSPTGGASAAAPAGFALAATATDSDGTVASVKFYANGVLVSTDTVAPFTGTYATSVVGSHSLTAVATDNSGGSKTSAAIAVQVTATNSPPTVSITSPTNGATALTPASFSVAATAADSGGTIQNVKFYADGVLLSTDATSPYALTYATATAGSHTLTAVATDNAGATSASAIGVTVTAAGAVTVTRRYVFDLNERLCKTIDPETGATLVDYDAAGNIAWTATGTALTALSCDRASVSAAQKITRSYDPMNRLKTVLTPGGVADVTTTYTGDGKVASLVAGNGASGANPVTTTYSYNKRRLLTQETSAQPTYVYPLAYGYNANGFLDSLTYPDTELVNYSPDALGRSTQVAAAGGPVYASAISYYPNGAIKSFTYGNGVTHTMTQNLRLLPTRSRDVGTVVVLDDSYAFDANGNVTDITDQAQAGLTTRGMGYDPLDRLTAAVAPGLWGNASYSYDGLDNLRSADQGPRQYRYNYASNNRLSTILTPAGATVWTFGHDANGNVTGKGSQGYQFDAVNRLSAVTGLQTYRYDGQGRRVQTTDADGKTTFWLYSQSGQVLHTSEARRSQNLNYLYLGNSLVATRAKAWGSGTVTVKYQHTDALGSIVAETSVPHPTTGVITVLKRNSYAPYGEAYAPTVIDGTGYTGHVMDQATGLTYAQQRYYDPQIGRFLSVDPIPADPDTGANFNSYWYANNNPYRYYDPDGRCTGSRIANADTTCASTGDYTTQGAGPSMRGASTVVQQESMARAIASYSGQAKYDSNTAVASAATDRPGGQRDPGLAGPFTLATAGLMALGARIEQQLDGIRRKSEGPQAEQYALVADFSQWYDSVRGGKVHLNAGDVWKYGQTTNSSGRYSAVQLRASGLRYEVQFKGSQRAVLIQEKVKLFNYYLQNSELPPGNRIFK